MTTLTVSAKYRIVIPARIRQSLRILPGAKLHAIEFRGRIVLVPVDSIKSVRGWLKGLDTSVVRDADH